MRTILAAAFAASVITAASVASASSFTSTGVIANMNDKTNTVWLRNGDAYRLPASIDLSGFKPGQRVHVSWNAQNPSSIDGRNSDESIWLLDATEIGHAGRSSGDILG
ncbi:DUF1344 domain-containing protein [Chelativorans sp. M5D2P16]|uniref:DUF1344 domain-containing protein n=1 Tax=Chelativorans sp. M5D2P16 TaxID=3095678 RepID=UPI002ACA7E20|nr:DUF1344 domain-containing protein [Chelativorans sp. M5D2P16]MDZ5699473.1 DUF1344 domain-containing protein [Chelativorans sp. M5D2P16]